MSDRDTAERYRNRFSGYDLETLQRLVDEGNAIYDNGKHSWLIRTSGPDRIVVPNTDWYAADAARRQAATPPERRPLRWARAVTPAITVGLDDSLTLVLQVPADATRLTISDGEALNSAVDEARQVRAQLEDQAADREAG